METLSLFVPVTEHQAVLDRLANRATPVDEIGLELQALRCLRENVECLVEELDKPSSEFQWQDMSDALNGVRAALAELRAIDEGEEP